MLFLFVALSPGTPRTYLSGALFCFLQLYTPQAPNPRNKTLCCTELRLAMIGGAQATHDASSNKKKQKNFTPTDMRCAIYEPAWDLRGASAGWCLVCQLHNTSGLFNICVLVCFSKRPSFSKFIRMAARGDLKMETRDSQEPNFLCGARIGAVCSENIRGTV